MNDPPALAEDALQTNEDTAVDIDVLSNDTDVDGSIVAASLAIESQPEHGTATVDAETHQVRYVPEANFNGVDTFHYRVSDDGSPTPAESSVGDVLVAVLAVNDPPDPGEDAIGTDEDTPVDIDVLANDTDLDGNLVPSSVLVVLAPQHGSASVNLSTGVITYTPDQDYNGRDSLVYRVGNDGTPPPAETANSLVNIVVQPVNDAPVLSLPALLEGIQEVPISISGASLADVDAEETTGGLLDLSIEAAHGTVQVELGSEATLTEGANESASMTLQGSVAALNTALATLAYTGDAWYYGPDTVTLTASDLGNTGAGGTLTGSAVAGVSLTPSYLEVSTLNDVVDGDITPGQVSLREALVELTEGGTVGFHDDLHGAIILDETLGEMVVDRSLNIEGPGADRITVSGGMAVRVFRVDDGVSAQHSEVYIGGLSISDGAPGTDALGGALMNRESLYIEHCVISRSEALAGGGIHNLGSLSLVECTGSGNEASESGGFLLNMGSGDVALEDAPSRATRP